MRAGLPDWHAEPLETVAVQKTHQVTLSQLPKPLQQTMSNLLNSSRRSKVVSSQKVQVRRAIQSSSMSQHKVTRRQELNSSSSNRQSSSYSGLPCRSYKLLRRISSS